jgi:flavin reductase (DIM6/NTAB) family NADH-FMN oxidoreductase RutF
MKHPLRFIEAANYTAIDTPSDVSEWTLSGLTPEPSVKVKPARVQEAALNMECELGTLYTHPILLIHVLL